MRTSILPFLLVFLAFPALTEAQQSGVDAALQQGNASALSPFFAKSIDLLILSDEATLAPSQAATRLSDFFAKSVVKGYKQNHVSNAQTGRPTYTIGDLTTGQGTYRLSVFYDASNKVSEIRIEK